ncbi:hypothetical protein BC829DRAFT_382743 [Chytridium lagenaria]|nr:hypothetical protein BC829DRAFT_382743 [Chytridium lagenaria]
MGTYLLPDGSNFEVVQIRSWWRSLVISNESPVLPGFAKPFKQVQVEQGIWSTVPPAEIKGSKESWLEVVEKQQRNLRQRTTYILGCKVAIDASIAHNYSCKHSVQSTQIDALGPSWSSLRFAHFINAWTEAIIYIAGTHKSSHALLSTRSEENIIYERRRILPHYVIRTTLQSFWRSFN